MIVDDPAEAIADDGDPGYFTREHADFPSTYPSSCSPCRKTSKRSRELEGSCRNPIRGTLFGCWASAEKQTAKNMAYSATAKILCFTLFSLPHALYHH